MNCSFAIPINNKAWLVGEIMFDSVFFRNKVVINQLGLAVTFRAVITGKYVLAQRTIKFQYNELLIWLFYGKGAEMKMTS